MMCSYRQIVFEVLYLYCLDLFVTVSSAKLVDILFIDPLSEQSREQPYITQVVETLDVGVTYCSVGALKHFISCAAWHGTF